MTIVFAQKFGNRILMCSDTMISDLPTGRSNIIPGRIKTVVLNQRVSVGYAGLANQAIDTIRRCANTIRNDGGAAEIVPQLLECNRTTAGACDFLIVEHDPQPRIFCVRNGAVSRDTDQAIIGDPEILRQMPPYNGPELKDMGEYGSIDEQQLRYRFSNLFFEQGTQVAHGVGGLPIFLLGSPYGHCYDSFAVSLSWEKIDLGIGLTPQQKEDEASGKTKWSFHVYDSNLRGIAVVGMFFEQGNIGYVHVPLAQDEPIVWRGIHAHFRSEVVRIAEQLAGQ